MLLRSFTVTFFSLCLFSLAASANQIIKSPNDTRIYDSFTLENQLKVVVISDPQTDKAAVSLDIDVGSANNPINRPGLAHFLEHMLFLGTKKYPSADEYSLFINTNGGSQNAFTSQDNTNYFFDIKNQSLDDALDRFSQFFIAPLFSEKYTQREKQAVHSEYQSRLKDDAQRNYSVFKSLMNPEHPGSRFFIGSLDSLSNTKNAKIRDDLITFYQQYYSANRMTVVILGKDSITDLKALAVKYFSDIKNANVAKPSISEPRFKPEQLPLIINTKTLKDFRLLTLIFPLPSTKHLYKQKPLYYISSLAGYEGEGSLISYLKEKGYANGLSASSSDESDIESALQISISLTKEGLKNKDEVIESFFYFMAKLKESGVKEDLYLEEQQLAQQAFQFLPKQHPSGYVVWLSQTMRQYPKQHWLNAGYIMNDFNPQSIQHFLEYVAPENLLINIQANSVTTTQSEPYFGGEFSTQAVSKQQLTQWNNPGENLALFIRKENPYIAEDLSILEPALSKFATPSNTKSSDARPAVYNIDDGIKLWHLKDKEFLTPKATLFFSLFMPEAKLSVAQDLALKLYTQLVNDKFNKLFYDAQSAGIYTELYSHRRGISIRVSGYNDKQPLVIEQFGLIRNATFSQSRFDILKGNYQRSLANSLKEKPYQQLLSQISKRLSDTVDTQTKLHALSKVTLKDVYKITNQLFNQAEVRILSHGNIELDQAKKLSRLFMNKINIKTTELVENPNLVLKLNLEQTIEISKKIDSSDSAVVLYLQGVDKTYKQRGATDLISEIISTDYSNQLRTEQQLGYLVFATSMNSQKMPGLAFVVQSPNASPKKISKSNQLFLDFVTLKLQKISPADLIKFKQSLITRYQTKERTIYQRSSRFWQALNTQVYNFDQQQSLITAVEQLSIKDLSDSWKVMSQKRIKAVSYANSP